MVSSDIASTNCGEEKIIPLAYKSRLCPSCTHIQLWRMGMFNPFKKKKSKRNLQGATSYYCPRCKKEQTIPSDIVYDFTKEKNSHPGGETLFVCTNCGTPMKPKEKEGI